MRSLYDALPLLASQAQPAVVAATTAELGLTAPSPEILSSVLVTAALIGLTAPSPSTTLAIIVTTAEIGLAAPDPILPGQGIVQATTAELALTAPSPALFTPSIVSVTTATLQITAPDPFFPYDFVTTEDPPEFPGVAIESTDGRQHRRQIAQLANRLNSGKMNVTGTLRLQQGAAKTPWWDKRLSRASVVVFDPLTDDALQEAAAGYPYALAPDRHNGWWELTHRNSQSNDRVFRVIILG